MAVYNSLNELTLSDQVYKFIKTLVLVEERQICSFFSEWGVDQVQYAIKDLKRRHRIFEQDGGTVSPVSRLPKSVSDYRPRLDAVHLLCYFKCDQILFFAPDSFPSEIIFTTTDKVAYDVTVFSHGWESKAAIVERTRPNQIPAGMPDMVNHVAIVPHESYIPKLRGLGFSLYVTIDHNGHAEIYEFED